MSCSKNACYHMLQIGLQCSSIVGSVMPRLVLIRTTTQPEVACSDTHNCTTSPSLTLFPTPPPPSFSPPHPRPPPPPFSIPCLSVTGCCYHCLTLSFLSSAGAEASGRGVRRGRRGRGRRQGSHDGEWCSAAELGVGQTSGPRWHQAGSPLPPPGGLWLRCAHMHTGRFLLRGRGAGTWRIGGQTLKACTHWNA